MASKKKEISVPKPFDYSSLSKETASKLIHIAGSGKRHIKICVTAIFEMGEELAEAQGLFHYEKNGGFNHWVEAEYGLSHQRAYEFIAVYSNKRLRMSPDPATFQPSALIELSRPNTPSGVLDSVLKLAKAGVKITHTIVKKLINDAKPKDKPKDYLELFFTGIRYCSQAADELGLAKEFNQALDDMQERANELKAMKNRD